MMKRHSELTMDEFIDRYENYHAKFGETLFAAEDDPAFTAVEDDSSVNGPAK